MSRPALLFDLDGTMLDTDAIHMAVFADMMAPRGLDVTHEFYMRHVHGRLNTDIFAEFLPDEPDPQGLSDAKEAEFRNRLPRPYPSMPGVVELVELAQSKGWGLAVVTNAMRLNAEAMLGAIGLGTTFDTIIIGEECPKGKPDPTPYIIAMQQLGVAPKHCIAFEDSPSGMRAAAASGAYPVGIRSSLSDSALREAGARDCIENFRDPTLTTILQRFDREALT